ncbi:MAG TPA: ATP-binding protein [Egibacteraceae bacterium]|nr:ATP-binding protein [Egibacteraceae bacterium]
MDSTPDRGTTGSRIEVALRRLAVGYRAVGAVWLTLLALTAAVPGVSTVTADPLVTGATIVLVAGWSALTGLVAARRPAALASPAWLAADATVAVATILAPSVAGAGAAAFYGGYPFSSVLLAATMRGLAGGLPVGAVLAVAAVGRLAAEGAPALPEALGSVILYLAGAGLVAWGADVLRRQDAERRAAEATLAVERAERVRSQERAETAAHLHDSVLQTLALIQRASDDPAGVTALARSCERELRGWLAGAAAPDGRRFGDAVRVAAAEVEAAHHVTVDVVTVGDAALDTPLAALVAAAREALVNAAKHAGVDRVSLYAEAGPGGFEVFVRDRGAGFDTDGVAPDRRGIAESIVGRVRRHGGEASVRSAPGQGTEVRLRLPIPGS